MAVNRLQLRLTGMSCVACAGTIEKTIAGQPGVQIARVNFISETLLLEYDPALTNLWTINAKIIELGYGFAKHKSIFPISDLHCASCVARAEKALSSVQGVLTSVVNLASNQAVVEYLDGIDTTLLRNAVKNAGYELGAELKPLDTPETENKRELSLLRRRLILAAFLAVLVMGIGFLPEFYGQSYVLWLLSTPVQFWAGARFYRGAWGALKSHTSDMNTLIAVGTSAAYFYSVVALFAPQLFNSPQITAHLYFDTSSTIIALILLGRYLEVSAKASTGEAIRRLIGLQPKTATVVKQGIETTVAIGDVSISDLIRIRPGERVPLDGIIREGASSLDESMITGESIPVDKFVGAEVTGGTLNLTGSFLYEATRLGENSTLGQIIRLVSEAQGSKAPVQRLADAIAARFVPGVIVIAVITFSIWAAVGPAPSITFAFLNFIAVLIIACPCALGLATPTAIIVGTGKGAENGILIRRAETLELTGKIDMVLFDKTGTITRGTPEVTDIVPLPPLTETDLLALSAAIESRSEHPLGRAIVRRASALSKIIISVDGFEALPGRGVKALVAGEELLIGNEKLMIEHGVDSNRLTGVAENLWTNGKTVMFVARARSLVGLVALADTLKPGAKELVARLKNDGIESVLLTGDNARAAWAVAGEVGIAHVIAGVSPQGKAEAVAGFKKEGYTVAMIGDGINDAPALAAADVGMAIGSGTDIAIETGDIILMGGELSGVTNAIALSRRTMHTIRQNLFWAFAYNTALIPVAAGVLYLFFGTSGVPAGARFILGDYGFLNPIMAAAAMAVSSLTVVSNSLRLRSFRPQ